MSLVIGVAPGARHTGVVLRQDNTLRGHQLVERTDAPIDWYLGDVVDAVTKLKNTATSIVLADIPNLVGSPAVLAIADPTFTHPNPPTDTITRALDVAQVVGAVAGTWITHRVTVAEIASQPLTFYPDRLTARGNDRWLRTAWDIAGAVLENQEEAAG